MIFPNRQHNLPALGQNLTTIKGQRSILYFEILLQRSKFIHIFNTFLKDKAHKHHLQAFLIPNINNMSIFEKYFSPKKRIGKNIATDLKMT